MTFCVPRNRTAFLPAYLALCFMAGCAWFREPPGMETPGATTGPKPMVTLKTLPDTSKAAPPGIDSTRTAQGSPPPQGPIAAPPPSTPPPEPESRQPTEPLIASPEGMWELSGQTLNTVTGPQGQETSIQAPVITHIDMRITATRGTYFLDTEQVDLQGNVRFQERKLSGRSAHAVYYRNQELLVADGGFVVDSDTLHLEGREGTYDRATDVIFVRGNVQGIRGKTTIHSDEAEWLRGRKEAFFRGHAVVVDPVQNTRTTGERIRYDLALDRAEVLESPELVISTHPENPIHVTSDRLRANPQGNVEAAGKVEITRGEVLAKADSAFFNRERHVAYMFGNPTVIQRDGTLNGDTLLLHFDQKDALERLQMHGNADLRFVPVDSAHAGEVSTVRGDSLTMFFRGDTTDKVVVVGNAHSTYRPSPRDQSEGVGTNVVDGDTISILLASNEIDRVVVAGNAKGTFIFGHEDSLAAPGIPLGSGSPDSLGATPADTMHAPPDSMGAPRSNKPQEKVIYSGDEVQFWVKTKIVDLRSDVTVDYGSLTLTAGKVRFYSDRRYMEAEEDPVLVDHGGDNKKVVGEHMDYNIHSREGTISGGRTETESGWIYSERLRQIGEKQFLARTGNFTTCDLAEKGKEPHFHFTSKKMRIYMNDKVIAKPVVLYIRDIPILAVPYYVFSVRKGRHSGFLAADLDLGLGSTTGRYFRNVGYYWAASQYWDLMATAQYSENPSRFVGNTWIKYAKRYLMSGQLNARKVVGSPEYDVAGTHQMKLGPWDVNARLESRTENFRQNDPLDPNLGARADVKLLSDLALSRSFSWNGSFRAELRQDKLLNPDQTLDQTTILNETLPQYSFSVFSRTLGRKGDENQPGHLPFLSTVRVDFSSSGSITHTVTQTGTVVTDSVLVDSTMTAVHDTLFTRFSDRPKQARHTFNISDTRKLGDFLNLTPRFTVRENWVDREFSATDTVMGFHRAATWNLSASANTALYGTIPGVGPLRALRHVFRPSATFTYQPEFEGLTYARKDSSDSTIGRASRFPGVFATEQRILSLGLEQSLQAKIGSSDHPKKISVFRWNLSAGYDFLAEDRGARPWSQVASNFTELLGTNLSFTSSHDPYHQFRFNNFQITGVGYSLRGKLPGGGDDLSTEDVGTTTSDESPWTSLGGDQSLGSQPGGRRGETQPLSWSTGFALSYGGSRNGDRFTTQATINGGFEIQLTKNWNLSYRPIIWDVTNGKIDGDSFRLTRALHCWQAEFGRTRSGDETSFFLKLGIRDLPDIRYQLGRQGSTGLSDFGNWLP